MKEKLKTATLYAGQIILTALASAIIAMLQNYLSAHTGAPADSINPTHTAAIGGIISSGHVGYKYFKANLS